MSNVKSQFGIRGAMLLMAALAVWLWYLLQFPGWFLKGETRFDTVVGIFIVSAFPLMAGGLGHLLFTRWFHFRLCVVVTSYLFFSVLLIFLSLSQRQYKVDLLDSFELVKLIQINAFQALFSNEEPSLWFAFIVTLVCCFPAHSIRPSLGTAIITAMGVAAWYFMGIFVIGSGG